MFTAGNSGVRINLVQTEQVACSRLYIYDCFCRERNVDISSEGPSLGSFNSSG